MKSGCVMMVIMSVGCLAAGPAPPARFEELRERPAMQGVGDPPPLTPLSGVDSRAAWEARRVGLRREWEAIVGALPPPQQRVPLASEVVSTEKLADHTRVLLRYSVDAQTRVEAYLLLPKEAAATRPRPGMVCLHPTSK